MEEVDAQGQSKLECERKVFSFTSADFAVSFLCTSIRQDCFHF